ncbi:MAG TPA: hypothetical protein VGH33_10170, partial [Isosphaeraceae bacterium]
LTDRKSIIRALGVNELAEEPPEQPEDLPAPKDDPAKNPKATLARCVGRTKALASVETTTIAMYLYLELARTRCPRSFAPFADEVESRIRPLFEASATADET